MTYRKLLLIILSCIGFLLLSACASPSGGGEQDLQKQRCKNLRQDLADTSRGSFENPMGNNPTQEATLQHSYARYQCADVLGETS